MTLNLPSPGRTRAAPTHPRILLAVAMLVAIWAGLPKQLSAQPVRNFELDLPDAAVAAIPKGWLGISTTETDLNGDGLLDTAVLIAPEDLDIDEMLDAFGPIRGTQLTDRCRNLIVLLGKAGEAYAVPRYFGASRLISYLVPNESLKNDQHACVSTAEPTAAQRSSRLFDWGGPLVTDHLSSAGPLLMYRWMNMVGTASESLLLRLEGDCFRVLGGQFEEVDSAGEAYFYEGIRTRDLLTRRRLDSDFHGSPDSPSESRVTILPLSERPEASEFICRSSHQPPSGARDAVPPPVSPPPKTTTPSQPKVANASAVQDPRWAHPPSGSIFSSARWGTGKEESYLRLPDGTVLTRPGITVWSTRGHLRIDSTSFQREVPNPESCPDWLRTQERMTNDPSRENETIDRCVFRWEELSAVDDAGNVVWKIQNAEDAGNGRRVVDHTLWWVTSDERGILVKSSTTWLVGDNSSLHAERAWWVDPATGEEISRSWPSAALATVEREFAGFAALSDQLQCQEGEACYSQVTVPVPPRPLAARYFQPVPTCGPIQEWTWTTTLAPYTAEEIAESPNLQCYTGVAREDETYEPCQPEDDVSNPWSVQTTMSPYDPGVVPTVDCAYPATGEPPIAVGWSALVP